MKILFLTNLLPYPLDNGGKIKTYTTLKALSSNNHNIDLICFTENETNYEHIKEIEKLCCLVKLIPLKLTTSENKILMLKKAFLSIFSQYSFGIYKYKSKKMNNTLIELLEKNNYDVIFYDHLQMFIYRDLIYKKQERAISILDEHNCEYLIMKRNAEKSNHFMKKLFLIMEYKKLMKFEIMALKKAHKIFVLSKEDKEELETICNQKLNAYIIPIGIRDIGVKNISNFFKDGKIKIMFLGTLTWAPNNQGIIWFMKNVMPLLKNYSDKIELYIVGKNPSNELIELTNHYSNVIITGYVDSVDEYYEKCDIMIVPIFIGSGQRVKIIEAFSRGFPVISTSIGAEGLNVEHEKNILIANTANDYVSMIEIIKNKNIYNHLAKNCRITFEKEYSENIVCKKIIDSLK